LILILFLTNALIFFFEGFSKTVYGPLLLPLMEDMAIGKGQAGMLVSLTFLGYSLLRFPSGIMVDILGRRLTILIGGSLMVLAFFGFGLAPAFYSLALFAFLLGAATGVYVTAGYTLAVNLVAPRWATRATALFELLAGSAAIFAPLLVNLFIQGPGWRALYLWAGGAAALATVIFAIFSRKPIDALHERSGRENLKPTLKALGQKEIRGFLIWAILVGGMGALTWTAFKSFIPTFLVEEKGYNIIQANRLWLWVPVTGMITKMGIAWLGDRFDSRFVMAGILGINLLVFSVFTYPTSPLVTLILLLLMGVTCTSQNTLINAHVMRTLPANLQGTGFGLFCTMYSIVYSLGPYLSGTGAEIWGLAWGLRVAVLGTVFALPLVMASLQREPRGQELAEPIIAGEEIR